MARCRAMTWRRTAAMCLLVFCLSVSATLQFAAQAYPDSAVGKIPQPAISAPDAGLDLVLANKIEKPSGPELPPAVFAPLSLLRLLSGNGKLRGLANDRFDWGSVESAIEIRGPPFSVSA